MRVAAIIPAFNEAATVARVAEVAARAELVDEVVVVDDGSTDDTAARAAAVEGVRVIRRHGPRGKGEAMAAGVGAVPDADTLVFLDADLVGLTAGHVDLLVWAISHGGWAMACGLFDRGPLVNPVFLRVLPVLTGERALRRDLFAALSHEDIRGYRVEAALNSVCERAGAPTQAFVLPGLWHRTKEEKRGAVRGFLAKQGMLATAVWSYAAYHHRHRHEGGEVPSPAPEASLAERCVA